MGALTNKRYVFNLRTWETITSISYDFFDSYMKGIKIDTVGGFIKRVYPEKGLVTDKIRYCYDGFMNMRLSNPKVPVVDGSFVNLSWFQVSLLNLLFYERSNKDVFGFIGGFVDGVSILFFKNFVNLLGGSRVTTLETVFNNFNFDLRSFYLSKINEVKKGKIVLIGTNLRMELPLRNLSLRLLMFNNKGISCHSLGIKRNLFYKTKEYSSLIKDILKLLKGLLFSDVIKIYIGLSFYFIWNVFTILSKYVEVERVFYSSIHIIYSELVGINILSRKIERGVSLYYYLGSFYSLTNSLKPRLVISMGTHIGINFLMSDLLLPTCFFTESSMESMNMFGKYIRVSNIGLYRHGDVKISWKIFQSLSILIGKKVFDKYRFIFLISRDNCNFNLSYNVGKVLYKNKFMGTRMSLYFGNDLVSRFSEMSIIYNGLGKGLVHNYLI